jgi:hypothetical protein
MSRAAYPASAFVAALVLAVSATVAEAALPAKGSFLNENSTSGAYLVTSRHTIRTLQLYCRQTNYDIVDLVHVRRDGTFSYTGKADRYGPGGELMGAYRVRLSGRFTSSSRVKIKRTLSGCGSGTVTAKRLR